MVLWNTKKYYPSSCAEIPLKLLRTHLLTPYLFFKVIFLSLHPLPLLNVKLYFICMGLVELRGTSNKRKFQIEKNLVHSEIRTYNSLYEAPYPHDHLRLIENKKIKVNYILSVLNTYNYKWVEYVPDEQYTIIVYYIVGQSYNICIVKDSPKISTLINIQNETTNVIWLKYTTIYTLLI